MTGVGQMLTDAREARRISIEQAERDTRIARRYLLALEAEDFQAFPARVYSRGFLRSYSSYLGLNPADLIALMPDDAADAADGPARRQRTPAKTPPPPRAPRVPELLTEGRAENQDGQRPGRNRAGDILPPAMRAALRRGQGRLREAAGNRPEQWLRLPVVRIAGAAVAVLVVAMLLGQCLLGRTDDAQVQTGSGGSAAPAFAPLPSIKRRMPDLRGMEEGAALAQLRALGVEPFVIELPSREAPAGQVVRQSPPPNGEIGTTIVTVVISRGG